MGVLCKGSGKGFIAVKERNRENDFQRGGLTQLRSPLLRDLKGDHPSIQFLPQMAHNQSFNQVSYCQFLEPNSDSDYITRLLDLKKVFFLPSKILYIENVIYGVNYCIDPKSNSFSTFNSVHLKIGTLVL